MAKKATAKPDQNPSIVGAEVYVLSCMWCDRHDGTPMMNEPSVHMSLDGKKGARTTMKKDIKKYLIEHNGFTDKTHTTIDNDSIMSIDERDGVDDEQFETFQDLEAYIDGNLEAELDAQSELSINVDGEGTNCKWSITAVKIQ